MTRRLAAVVAATLVASPAGAAREPAAPTLGSLGQRSAPVDHAVAVEATAGQAAASYEAFLALPDTDPAMRAQALRRLGDLRLAEAETLRAESGAESAAAADASRQAVSAYRRLLDEQPDAKGADAVLYQLARACEGAGDAACARGALDRLATEHPGGAHYDEAEFRRGEAFFSEGRYADAERAYAAVQAIGPESGFYLQAVYKRGWSLFKQSKDGEADDAFLTLLDHVLVRDGRLRPAQDLTRPEQELSADALRALAITFANADGAATLDEALARHGDTVYEARVYGALGDLYVEKERYQDAAEAYRAYAARRPGDPEAPLMLVRATEAYSKGGFASLVLEGQRQLVLQYGPGSADWRAKDGRVDPVVAAALQAGLLDLARHHHALAQKGSATDLDEAVRWYRDYLAGFNDAPGAPATRLLLAGLLLDGRRYAEAATEYELAAYSYAPNAESARAGYAALVAWDKAAAAAEPGDRGAIESRGIESSLKFAAAFPEDPETPAVLTRTAKALFDAGDRVRAEAVAGQVLALGSRADAAQQRVAWTVLAHTAFDAGRYGDAERAYAQLSQRLPTDDPQVAEVRDRLAASVYRQGEALQQGGDAAGAVREYLRVASVAPATTAAARGQYDAATLLLASGDNAAAANVLERFRADYPQDELQPEVTRRLALAYEASGRPVEAAAELERVAARDAEPPGVRRAAQWQAAELYAGAGDVAGARRAYADYVARFPQPVDVVIEAQHELALLASRAGDEAARERWLAAVVESDASAGAARTDRTRLLAAQASLELARPLDAAARAVPLVVPLEKSLARRKAAMEAALVAWSRAADYAIADVTTEATWSMADLYRDFGSALLASERPRGLSGEELEQYDLLLEEQAWPFEEKAISVHHSNAKRAASGTWDAWVRRSFDALATLNPARYRRSERVDAPDAAPGTPPAALEALVAASAAITDGDWTLALERADVALALDPTNAVARNYRGVALRNLGRFGAARETYEQAIAGSPGHPTPERNLGVLLDLYLDQPAEALPHYERYQLLTGGADPDTGPWLVELRTRLGQVERTAEARP
jgi:tetratricopeptide (TPR) repeat protein